MVGDEGISIIQWLALNLQTDMLLFITSAECGEQRLDVNMRNGQGHTAFMTAAGAGNIQAATLLSQAGAQHDLQANNEHGQTALHFAASTHQVAMIQFLTSSERGEKRMNPNIVDKKGVTPLMLAVRYGRMDVVIALLTAGADPTLGDSYGNTALHWAAYNNQAEVIQYLVAEERGNLRVNHETKNRQGRDALMFARAKQCKEAAAVLQSLINTAPRPMEDSAQINSTEQGGPPELESDEGPLKRQCRDSHVQEQKEGKKIAPEEITEDAPKEKHRSIRRPQRYTSSFFVGNGTGIGAAASAAKPQESARTARPKRRRGP